MPKNKKWSASAKFEIVLKVIKGETTLNEICTRYQVAPSQVHAWKKHFFEQGKDMFEKNRNKSAANELVEHERKQSKLYETIGQLTVERDFLKKSWDKFQGNDGES